jgi:regulator of sigma E protease
VTDRPRLSADHPRPFLLVIGPLVFLHELGHYLAGRLFGVKAETFSIGFGPRDHGWTDKRGTRWKFGAAAWRLCQIRRRHEPGERARSRLAALAAGRAGADLPFPESPSRSWQRAIIVAGSARRRASPISAVVDRDPDLSASGKS